MQKTTLNIFGSRSRFWENIRIYAFQLLVQLVPTRSLYEIISEMKYT